MSVILYQGTYGFNKEWAASKSFKEFAEHEAHHNLSKEQLKEVHELCKVPEKKEEVTPVTEQ